MDTTIVVENTKNLNELLSIVPNWLLLSGFVIWFFFNKIYPKIIPNNQNKVSQKTVDKANGNEYVLAKVFEVHIKDMKETIIEVKTEVGKLSNDVQKVDKSVAVLTELVKK